MPGVLFDQMKQRLTRRRVIFLAAAGTIGLSAELTAMAIRRSERTRPAAKPATDIYEQVMPEKGIDTGVTFGDAIQKVISAGALDPNKLRAQRHTLPDWVERLLAGPSEKSIVLSRERAPYLVNLLWPIGLSNRTVFNHQSPINTDHLPGFASTGGWTLGRAPNGFVYFDSVDAVPLTDSQAFLALAIATNTFRPCCDNSTFFQDCNHGSALLGLIALAVSQGQTAAAVYRIALTANSYWFPEQYARTAQHFSRFENRSWDRVSSPLVLSAAFSSLSGWKQHVDAPLWQAGLSPPVNPTAQPQACGL
jgi:hypothetical protein